MQTISLQNGVDVSSIPVRTPLDRRSDEDFVLLAVGNPKPWHGLDRVIVGLGRYVRERASTDPVVRLKLVGASDTSAEGLEMLARSEGVSELVDVHPPMWGEELDMLYDSASIALGSLGIHRIGLTSVCTLKAREYCARGIPFVLSYSDPDFDSSFRMCLELPADDSPANIAAIVAFVSEMAPDHSSGDDMREYARDNLDWSVKMTPVVEQLYGRGDPPRSSCDISVAGRSSV